MSLPESNAAPNGLMNAYTHHREQKVTSNRKRHHKVQEAKTGRAGEGGGRERDSGKPLYKS